MTLSEAGLELIKRHEQCRYKAYRPTPNDVPTIGWGHTKGVSMGDTCTQAQADAWLQEDLLDAENCVSAAISLPLTSGEYAALVSLVYNIGCGAFHGSTLLKLILDADMDGAALQFARWNKQAGHELAGLTRRRADEAQLFESTA